MSWPTSDLDWDDLDDGSRWHRATSDVLFVATGLSFGLLSIATWLSCWLYPHLRGRGRTIDPVGRDL